jgi:hypothetical protein
VEVEETQFHNLTLIAFSCRRTGYTQRMVLSHREGVGGRMGPVSELSD